MLILVIGGPKATTLCRSKLWPKATPSMKFEKSVAACATPSYEGFLEGLRPHRRRLHLVDIGLVAAEEWGEEDMAKIHRHLHFPILFVCPPGDRQKRDLISTFTRGRLIVGSPDDVGRRLRSKFFQIWRKENKPKDPRKPNSRKPVNPNLPLPPWGDELIRRKAKAKAAEALGLGNFPSLKPEDSDEFLALIETLY